jgi:hypothetical protein
MKLLRLLVPRAALSSAIAVAGTLVAPSPAIGSVSRMPLGFTGRSSIHGANHFVLRRAGAKLRLLDADTGAVSPLPARRACRSPGCPAGSTTR